MPNEHENEGKRGRGKPDERPDPGWPKGPEVTMFKLNINITHDVSPPLLDALTRCESGPADHSLLERILQKLVNLKEQVNTMAQELNARIAALDANATRTGNAIAAAAENIRILTERQLTGKLTDAEYDAASNRITEIANFLDGAATQLEGLGHGPVDPPPINPEDVPPVEG